MNLSKNTIGFINGNTAEVPGSFYFDLPEKVLQFGTGVLLRGLPDYFIDKANKAGIFNGRIVAVKSTRAGEPALFAQQDNLYTLCVRGTYKGEQIDENIINASISRVLSAANQWDEVMACAANPHLQVIISNTTEVGIQLTDDNIFASPPVSFPGKLLAFLYQRYKLYHGDATKGMVIVPTELIPGNGDLLQSVVLELSHINRLDAKFIDWLENANYFCNSLVDRIVPGKLNPSLLAKTENYLGYHDDLLIMSEAYRLWAIESSSEKVGQVLSFAQADEGVIIADDISIYREMKLRLLNGSHTFSCGLAFLPGLTTVKKAMDDKEFLSFITHLMFDEIVPSIASATLTAETASAFAKSVIDRFKNPAIEHLWINISAQFSSKMATRNVPLIKKYYSVFGKPPVYMALGFAAYILFMKPVKSEGDKFYGRNNLQLYPINDIHANWFFDIWQSGAGNIAEKVLGNTLIWETDLNALPGFTALVQEKINFLQGVNN